MDDTKFTALARKIGGLCPYCRNIGPGVILDQETLREAKSISERSKRQGSNAFLSELDALMSSQEYPWEGTHRRLCSKEASGIAQRSELGELFSNLYHFRTYWDKYKKYPALVLELLGVSQASEAILLLRIIPTRLKVLLQDDLAYRRLRNNFESTRPRVRILANLEGPCPGCLYVTKYAMFDPQIKDIEKESRLLPLDRVECDLDQIMTGRAYSWELIDQKLIQGQNTELWKRWDQLYHLHEHWDLQTVKQRAGNKWECLSRAALMYLKVIPIRAKLWPNLRDTTRFTTAHISIEEHEDELRAYWSQSSDGDMNTESESDTELESDTESESDTTTQGDMGSARDL